MLRQSSAQVIRQSSPQVIRTRIAPSPTGIPHIGTTTTALFNFLFARHERGKFILRIEDTDRARFVEEAEKTILEILEWLGLTYDGEVIKQSNRLNIYNEHAEILRKKDLAYEDQGAVRFKMPKDGVSSWLDAIGDKKIVFENNTQEDFVIIKSDGYPTYNFANVIDDHLMEITHVIRGVEFISSTPKHIQLYKSFGWDLPKFAHLPVILGTDKQKLSKRHGAKSVLDYRDEGYLKEALLNYMVFLGWNPGGNKEFMTISEMIKLFDLKGVNASNPIFDLKKLTWMNQQYIQNSSDTDLKQLLLDFSQKAKNTPDDILDKFIPLLKSRMETLADFEKLTGIFFGEFPEQSFSDTEKQIAKDLNTQLATLTDWKHDMIFAVIKNNMDKYNVRMPVFYKLLTGTERGLPLPETLEILGKEKSLKRLMEVSKI